MMQVYPVIFTPTQDGYVASVPDLDIDTQGRDLAEAIMMARDAIGLWGISEQDAGRTIPAPSATEPPHEAGETVSWVDIDFDAYRRQYDMTAERTNVTIPRFGQ